MAGIITEKMKLSIRSLIPVMDGLCAKHENLTYKMGVGKNENGIYIKYRNKKIGDLWNFERDGKIVYQYYTYFISDEDKLNSINIPKGSARGTFIPDNDGKKVYVHHIGDESYKMEVDSVDEIVAEIEKSYKAVTNLLYINVL